MRWEDAQFNELIPPTGRSIINTAADLAVIVEEKKQLNRLLPVTSSESFYKQPSQGVLKGVGPYGVARVALMT